MVNAPNGGPAEDINNPRVDQSLLKDLFLKDFRTEIKDLEKEEDRIKLYNEITAMHNDRTKAVSVRKKMQSYQKSKGTKYESLRVDEITIDEVQNSFSGDLRELEIDRAVFKKTIIDEFDGVDEAFYDTNIFPLIETFGRSKFLELKKSKAFRKKFINDKLQNNAPTPKVKFDYTFLNDFRTSIETKLAGNSLNEKEKEELKELVLTIDRYSNPMKKWDSGIVSAIQVMIEKRYLGDAVLKDFIKKYVPFSSLGTLQENDILSENEVLAKANNYINANHIFDESIDNDPDLNQRQKIAAKISKYGLLQLVQVNIDNTILNDPDKFEKLLQTDEDGRSTVFVIQTAQNFVDDVNSDFDEALEDYFDNDAVKTFYALKKKLVDINKNHKFRNIEKFEEGAIIEVNNEGVISYLKVIKVDDDKKKLVLGDLGTQDNVSRRITTEGNDIFYSAFEKSFTETNYSLDFLTQDEFNDRIKKGAIKVSDLLSYTLEDFEDQEKREFFEQKYKDDLQLKLEKLLEQQEANRREGKKDQILDANIEKIQAILDGAEITNIDLFNHFNINSLVQKLDDLDPEGAELGLDVGIYLETKDGAGHEITGIDKGVNDETGEPYIYVEIRTQNRKNRLSFDDFYKVFKKREVKRVKKINDFGELVTNFKSSKGGAWNDYDFSGNKLKIKEKPDNLKDDEVEYFVSKKDDSVIRVKSISSTEVIFQYGERKEIDVNKEKAEKKKKKKQKGFKKLTKEVDGNIREQIGLDSRVRTASIHDFKRILESEGGYEPDVEVGKNRTLKPEDLQNEIKRGFWGTVLEAGVSYETFYKAGVMVIDGVKAYLDKGRDLKAAKLALKAGGVMGLVSSELESEMRIMAERAESEAMDKELESLKKVDSWIAVERIERWLLEKTTPEYKKEAGLLFMYENYGHLTAKGPLAPYRGRFLWYEAFGGRIGDKFYREQEQKAKDSDITFSEEALMYEFTKIQSGGYNGIRRRSRLYKEIDAKWSNGIKGDYEKGQGDADKKRKAKDRTKGGMDEAFGGTTSNAIGWFERAVDRGAELEVMAEGFFCLMFSGCLYDVDQKTFALLKTLWQGRGIPLTMIAFSTTKSDMELYNKVIVALSEEISNAYGDKYKNMHSEAKAIFNSAIDPAKRGSKAHSEKSRLEASQKFWRKYGTPLGNALHTIHTTNTEHAKTDKIIMLKKDENPIFKAYYDALSPSEDGGFTSLGEVFHKDFIDDAIGDFGCTGVSTYKNARKYIGQQRSGGFKEVMIGPKVWRWMVGDIDSVKNKKFSDDPELDIEYKKKYLVMTLKDIIGALVEMHGGAKDVFESFDNKTSEIGQDFKRWSAGLDSYAGRGLLAFEDFTSLEIRKEYGKGGKADKLLEDMAMNIIGGRAGGTGDGRDFGRDVTKILNIKREDNQGYGLAA